LLNKDYINKKDFGPPLLPINGAGPSQLNCSEAGRDIIRRVK